MNEFLIELLEDCEGVSNVKIVCKDGILFSHKVIVGNVSSFIKNIFLSIPFGDDITLFLPEYKKESVEEFLLTKKDGTGEDIFADQNPTLQVLKFLTGKEEDEDEEEDDECYELEDEEFDQNFKEENESPPQIKITSTASSPKKELMKKPPSPPKKTDVPGIKALKENVQMNFSCEELEKLEKELIPNPTTDREKYRNHNILKKIACEKALAYFKSDDSVSYRAAAKKFGIAHSTLMGIIKDGKQFKGQGCRDKYLTDEEEKFIVDRVLEVVRNDQQLDSRTVKLRKLRKIIQEEIEIIRINFPERRGLNDIRNFCYAFIRRHDLDKYYKKDGNFQCDVCFKGFTMKNAMVLHQKNIHYSFLQ